MVGFGDSGSVGVGGITLGGGIGFLVRKLGLTVDSVLAAEVVTADGRHLRADAGEDASAERAIAPFRSLATPLADMVKPGPYAAMYPPEDASYRPTAVARTMFVDSIDATKAQTTFDHLSTSDAVMRVAQPRALGGAAARVPADATACAHRSKPMLVNVAAFYQGEADRDARRAWATAFARALQPNDDAAYVGFLTDDGDARIRVAYPGATWDRLTRIKSTYDPTNLFRLNQNIPSDDAGRR